jgi:hypothetical protein
MLPPLFITTLPVLKIYAMEVYINGKSWYRSQVTQKCYYMTAVLHI